MSAIARGADIAGVTSVGNVATLSNVAIGTASQDRIVVLCVGGELSQNPGPVTIDYGLGPLTMNAGTLASFGSMRAQLFWLNAPIGTTATFAVTWTGATTAATTHYATYAVTASALTPTQNVNTSTDMDATAPLTTGAQTIATNGGFLAVAVGAALTTKTWANATVDINTTTANFGFTTSTRVTALSATAITCTGSTNNEDGALAWMIFDPGSAIMPISASATGQVGTLGIQGDASPTLVAVSASGQFASFTPNPSKTLTPDFATGQFGTLTPNPSVTLTPAPASGLFASFVPEVSKPLDSVFASELHGSFTPQVTVGGTNYGFATFIPPMGGM